MSAEQFVVVTEHALLRWRERALQPSATNFEVAAAWEVSIPVDNEVAPLNLQSWNVVRYHKRTGLWFIAESRPHGVQIMTVRNSVVSPYILRKIQKQGSCTGNRKGGWIRKQRLRLKRKHKQLIED